MYERSSNTIWVCSSTSQGHTYLINRATTVPSKLTDREVKPFPGDQIQCATVVPASSPHIVLVNIHNKVFTMRRENNLWKSEAIKVKLEKARKDVCRFDEKMSIAATDKGITRTFWMQGEQGRLLNIRPHEFGPFEPEEITMPFQSDSS